MSAPQTNWFQRLSSIPVQTSRVALLDLIASLLLNQILRELKRTMFLQTQFIIIIGHCRCHCCHCHVRSLRLLSCPSIAIIVIVAIVTVVRFEDLCWLLCLSIAFVVVIVVIGHRRRLFHRCCHVQSLGWLSCPSMSKYSFTSATIAEYFVRENGRKIMLAAVATLATSSAPTFPSTATS